jgi:hypothetical protein
VTVNGGVRSGLYAAMPADAAKASACTSGLAATNGDAHTDASALVHIQLWHRRLPPELVGSA